MMRLQSVLTQFPELDSVEVTTWIERQWVQPDPAGEGEWNFHEVDVARVRLIQDLRRDLDVGEKTVPLVLSLIDQVYELRCRMKAMIAALAQQPPEVRQAVLAALPAAPERDDRST